MRRAALALVAAGALFAPAVASAHTTKPSVAKLERQVVQLQRTVKALEHRPAPAPSTTTTTVVGQPGPQGAAGASVTDAQVQAAVAAYLAAHPPAAGPSGPPGAVVPVDLSDYTTVATEQHDIASQSDSDRTWASNQFATLGSLQSATAQERNDFTSLTASIATLPTEAQVQGLAQAQANFVTFQDLTTATTDFVTSQQLGAAEQAAKVQTITGQTTNPGANAATKCPDGTAFVGGAAWTSANDPATIEVAGSGLVSIMTPSYAGNAQTLSWQLTCQ